MTTLHNRTAAARAALAIAVLTLSAGAQPVGGFLETLDANGNGQVSRDELRAAMVRWLGGRDRASADQFEAGLRAAIPEQTFLGLISPPASRTPRPEDVQKMMAALPAAAPAKPARPRRVLVLNTCAGFVHASIPLAAKTIEELGAKTGAWATTISYDPAVINAAILKRYDLVLLNNTTGQFLDDPNPAVTEARKKALLEFVRSGRGLAGIHAASDSYHRSTEASPLLGMIAANMMLAADSNEDQSVDAAELTALADGWFDKADTAKAGEIAVPAFRAALPRLLFGMRGGRRPGAPSATPPARTGPDPQVGTWPEFNKLIGGFFKWHWNDPQQIVYKIDDPESPLTAMFRGGFTVNDETYTFGIKSFSRENLRVLASVDYDKMSEADKAKEEHPRADHDYGLSWIRREGKGRVFYAAHGHSERVYAIKPFLEHLLAGVQYALGDLKAKDDPSAKPKK